MVLCLECRREVNAGAETLRVSLVIVPTFGAERSEATKSSARALSALFQSGHSERLERTFVTARTSTQLGKVCYATSCLHFHA